MCRYALSAPYKDKYACFHCRKMFRQTSDTERIHPTKLEYTVSRFMPCPECKQPMHNVGLDFKVPHQADTRHWRTIEMIYHAGVRFHSCGCDGPGWRPRTPAEVPLFLAEHEQGKKMQKAAQDKFTKMEKRKLRRFAQH